MRRLCWLEATCAIIWCCSSCKCHDPNLIPGVVYWLGEGFPLYGSGGDCGGTSLVYGTPAVMGLAVPSVEPLRDALPGGTAGADRLALVNPTENGGDVAFVLGRQSEVLAAGDIWEIQVDSAEIHFDRGGDFGEARYRLRPGGYRL